MNKFIAEFLGTALLVFVIFSTGNFIAIGATLALGILIAGPISGAAFNPAVTLALVQAGKLSRVDLVPYIAAQLVGAIAGYKLFEWSVKQH